MTASPFIPNPGFVIVTPYVNKEKTFNGDHDTAGEAQKGEVVAVGSEYSDRDGQHEKPCKVGDIVIHHYVSDSFTWDNTKYIAIHFTHVFAVKNK